jgi:uncharacterized membrane protein (UPF0136 family)
VLIVSTPLLVIPAILALHSPLGVNAETISLVVTAFFAVGHHLPGLIRAYGDRELFQRFHWRFILAPPLLFIAYFSAHRDHPDFYPLIIVFCATWHGLMQLYGFVRIYDAKVGSTSPVTAYWDWLVCLFGFVTAQLFSPARMSNLLGYWYSFGGPLVPPSLVHSCRWIFLTISTAVLIGFAVNYVVQSVRGPKPNPIKLLLLASGLAMMKRSVLGYFAACLLTALLLFFFSYRFFQTGKIAPAGIMALTSLGPGPATRTSVILITILNGRNNFWPRRGGG